MPEYDIIRLCDRPELKEAMAAWFHGKWGIPLEAYVESMEDCIAARAPVPQWYGVFDGDRQIAGLGVIENDFHERKDLAPNVCAVYVEKDCRCRGVARGMLDFACGDMKARGIDTLYLLTSHTSLYERFGWEFFCMARCDGEAALSRVYVHREL